jgi:UDP-glucose 4-epimerase
MNDAILVLGASGFIGRRLAESFAADGNMVVAATRHATLFAHPGVTNVVAPFNMPEHFTPLLNRCRWVVHAASTSTPGSSAATPLMELETLRPTLALLTALQDPSARRPLLYLSSGGTLYGDREGDNAHEPDPLRPRSYHGAGKAAAEFFIHAWTEQYDGAAVVLRPSNVFGPGQLPRAGFGIIPAAFEHARNREAITIWGDGSAVRDYLYVDDFVALCRAVLATTRDAGLRVFNASRGTGVSVEGLLDAIDAVTGQPLQRVHAPGRAVDIQHIVPDNAAACAAFGWQPQVSLHDGLRQTWRWFTTPR